MKNRSVASELSVIDFERGERAKGERAWYEKLSHRTAHNKKLLSPLWEDRSLSWHWVLQVGLNYELYIAPSPYGSVRTRSKWLTDNSDATDFIFSRIFLILRFTWSWMYFGLYLRLCGADCQLYKESVYSPRSKEIRKNQGAVQVHRNPKINLIK